MNCVEKMEWESRLMGCMDCNERGRRLQTEMIRFSMKAAMNGGTFTKAARVRMMDAFVKALADAPAGASVEKREGRAVKYKKRADGSWIESCEGRDPVSRIVGEDTVRYFLLGFSMWDDAPHFSGLILRL